MKLLQYSIICTKDLDAIIFLVARYCNCQLIFNFKKSGENIKYKDFRLQLVWDLIKEGLEEEEKQHT
jgi:hypothetical protein